MKKNTFFPEKGLKIDHFITSKVFNPTRTSELIVKSLNRNKNKLSKAKKILDLGCGSGVIGITIKKKILKNSEVFFSDFSKNAIKITKKNLILNKLNCEVKKSNLMNAWKKTKFDLIINDVSGISSFFLKKKMWYNNFIPCDTSLDGTKLTIRFFENFRKQKSLVILPLISLSKVSKVKKYLIKRKIKFKTLLKEQWPLPNKLVNKYLKSLIILKKKKLINYKKKFGMYIAYTEILLVKL